MSRPAAKHCFRWAICSRAKYKILFTRLNSHFPTVFHSSENSGNFSSTRVKIVGTYMKYILVGNSYYKISLLECRFHNRWSWWTALAKALRELLKKHIKGNCFAFECNGINNGYNYPSEFRFPLIWNNSFLIGRLGNQFLLLFQL